MTAPSEWRCPTDALPPGRSVKFMLRCQGRPLEGFVVNHDGRFHAYLNRCPHVGTPLDLWPNEFFADNGRALVCATHGAIYEPDTGRCTAGPCVGDALTALPVRRDGGVIVVACPAA